MDWRQNSKIGKTGWINSSAEPPVTNHVKLWRRPTAPGRGSANEHGLISAACPNGLQSHLAACRPGSGPLYLSALWARVGAEGKKNQVQPKKQKTRNYLAYPRYGPKTGGQHVQTHGCTMSLHRPGWTFLVVDTHISPLPLQIAQLTITAVPSLFGPLSRSALWVVSLNAGTEF